MRFESRFFESHKARVAVRKKHDGSFGNGRLDRNADEHGTYAQPKVPNVSGCNIRLQLR